MTFPSYGAVEINYSYDDLNRLDTVTRTDGPMLDYNYDEAGNITDQTVSNSPDTDADLLANFADPDDDGDGMPDAWEVQYGLNPLNPADAAQDNDLDGIPNLAEYQAGTSPLQANNGTPVPTLPEWGTLLLAFALMLMGIRQTTRQGQ